MTAGVGDDRSPATVEKPWTREEDKAFETALATAEAAEGRRRWEGIASWVPARTADEVRRHYELLVDDVKAIEEGRIELPAYGVDNEAEKGLGFVKGSSKGLSRSEQDRRKGIPWTEKEHKLFLIGLEKFGKGDWRSISRNYVTSRTPTQVASHAQKYFNRLNSANRDRRRTSIHDITADLSSSPKPNSAHTLTGAQMNHVGPAMVQGVAVYGQPVPGHGPVPAVGTPVMFPPQPVPGYAAPPYVVPAGYPAPPLGPPHNMNLH